MDRTKNVISFETYHERDLIALADSLANCCFNRIAGRCIENQCSKCAIDKQWRRCYEQLSDMDKQRVRNIARYKLQTTGGSAIIERFILGKDHRINLNTDKGISKWLRRAIFRMIIILGGIVCIGILLYWLFCGVYYYSWTFPPW